MISQYLRTIVRCPKCLLSAAAHASSTNGNARQHAASSAPVLEPLDESDGGLSCPRCRTVFASKSDGGYLDLRPPAGTFSDLTEYAEEEFHHRVGKLRPLFLSAKIKMDMMTKMLELAPSDRVLDIGCGNGRFVFFKRPSCGRIVGIDAGAHFVSESLATVDLVRGDVRVLPFANESFDKAFSLDVLEHLSEEGVVRMLEEARRVLRPGGLFFLYSHVMMSSRIAAFQRGVNRLVRFLDRHGLLDNEPERQRKSDHRNALRSYDQLDEILERTGFRIEAIRYYNVVFKALFEDLLLPIVEHNFYSSRASVGTDGEPISSPAAPPKGEVETEQDHHHHGSTKPDVGRWAHAPLHLATYLMKLDVALFGRVRTGPFFLLLRAV